MKLPPIATQSQSAQLIGPRFRLVRTFDLAPFIRARRSWWTIPRVETLWAEFYCPCGAQNKDLSPRIVASSPENVQTIEHREAVLVSPRG